MAVFGFQVKFLSQEEEEARVDFGKKEAVFTEEIARLQASLKAERAAVVEARKDNGTEGKRELEGYLKWVDCVGRWDFQLVDMGVAYGERSHVQGTVAAAPLLWVRVCFRLGGSYL